MPWRTLVMLRSSAREAHSSLGRVGFGAGSSPSIAGRCRAAAASRLRSRSEESGEAMCSPSLDTAVSVADDTERTFKSLSGYAHVHELPPTRPPPRYLQGATLTANMLS